MAVPDENVNPMDHFEDNFGQKRGSEVETNSAVSFVSDMLDIKGKCDPRMYNFDAYRRTKSTLQEHNVVKQWKSCGILITIAEFSDDSVPGTEEVDSQNNLMECIYVTSRFYEDSGI